MTQGTAPTAPSPADPGVSEDALAAQPVAYWTGVTTRAVTALLRDAMARADVTQPQWWIINTVDAAAPTREEVARKLADVADGPYEIPRAVDQLLHRGWIAPDGEGRLGLTEAGREAKGRIKLLVTEVRTRVHEGVDDEEYVAALKVLRRMIRNVQDIEG